MPDHLFEYAVIRVVPRVEREEFVNIGVIVYCARQKFLKTIVSVDEVKIKILSKQLDLDCLKDNVTSFEMICNGATLGGPIAKLDLASRFRWLTATRSTVLQSSKVHPGLCKDAQLTLLKLFDQLVQ